MATGRGQEKTDRVEEIGKELLTIIGTGNDVARMAAHRINEMLVEVFERLRAVEEDMESARAFGEAKVRELLDLRADAQRLTAEVARLTANADQLRSEAGECHLMISRKTTAYQLNAGWEPTSLPFRFQRTLIEAETRERALVEALREIKSLSKTKRAGEWTPMERQVFEIVFAALTPPPPRQGGDGA